MRKENPSHPIINHGVTPSDLSIRRIMTRVHKEAPVEKSRSIARISFELKNLSSLNCLTKLCILSII
jgi:hypothetical protein